MCCCIFVYMFCLEELTVTKNSKQLSYSQLVTKGKTPLYSRAGKLTKPLVENRERLMQSHKSLTRASSQRSTINAEARKD